VTASEPMRTATTIPDSGARGGDRTAVARNGFLVEMRDIVKRFPGVLAVDRVGFDLRPGEVHALLGANGAGKSTLIKILAGVYHRDGGEVRLRGEPVEIHDPRHAQQLGIATIYQEYNLVPDLSVAENVSLGHLPRGTSLPARPFINRKEMFRRTERLLEELQVDIQPAVPVRRLGVAKQQMVEIAKALALDSEIYIMDEPTAALSSKEIEELFRVTHSMKERGCAVIYISHRLEEVGRIADRVTVMRDGRKVDTLNVENAPTDRLVELMVGRTVKRAKRREGCTPGRELLRAEGLTRKGAFEGIELRMCAGEIVGLAGVMGSGRTEIARAIFGADRLDSGQIRLDGEQLAIRSPNHAVRRGICYLPEDRKSDGLVLCGSVRDNVVLASLSRFCRLRLRGRGILLDRPRIRKEVVNRVKELDIKTPGISQLVEYLSGGNQQKVVVARWLCSKAKVFLFDEPTRGIDVGAKSEIYGLVQSLAEEGACVLLITSEVEELVDVCDRVYVLRHGRIVSELGRAEISKERILSIALTGNGERTPRTTPTAGEAERQGGEEE
jgi:ribose transport system ATP-binding protein